MSRPDITPGLECNKVGGYRGMVAKRHAQASQECHWHTARGTWSNQEKRVNGKTTGRERVKVERLAVLCPCVACEARLVGGPVWSACKFMVKTLEDKV